jgi:hypothetical protein
MILVASIALSISWYRAVWSGGRVTAFLGQISELRIKVSEIESLTVEGLIPLTIACLCLRLRQPRPALRRIARQPGFLACWAASIPILLHAMADLAVGILRDDDLRSTLARMEWQATSCCGYIVAGVWGALALGGRWRAEPGWIDRLGIGIGLAWIALAILELNIPFL